MRETHPAVMVVVLTAITCICGLSLGALNAATEERIQDQQLRFKQLPALQTIFSESKNDFLADRRNVEESSIRVEGKAPFPWLFLARDEGGAFSGVAFESASGGYDGRVGVMVGFDAEGTKLVGVAVTTHSETPGVGARAATEPGFVAQFAGLPLDTDFRVSADGGAIDAITGASITSRAVCKAVSGAVATFRQQGEAINAAAANQQGGAQ